MEDLLSVSYQAYKYEQNTVCVPHKLNLGPCDPSLQILFSLGDSQYAFAY